MLRFKDHAQRMPKLLEEFLWHLSSPSDLETHLTEATIFDRTPRTNAMIAKGPEMVPMGENLHKRIRAGFEKTLTDIESESPAERRLKLHQSRKVIGEFARSYGLKTGLSKGLMDGRNAKIKASPDLMGSNAKLQKSGSRSVSTLGISFAPHTLSGLNGFNVCPKASTHCSQNCLGITAGATKQFPDHSLSGKVFRTHLLAAHPEHFARLLHHEIGLHVKKSEREGNIAAVRFNVTSDLPVEMYKSKSGKSIMDHHPNAQFYDYTKIASRMDKELPSNLHLTLSSTGEGHDESNSHEVSKALEKGHVVAMVIHKGKTNPTHVEDVRTGRRYPIVNGDKDDWNPGRHAEAGLTAGHPYHGVVTALSVKGTSKEKIGPFAHTADEDGIVRINKNFK